ncbi:MAG: carbon-nitrogen hydrolase family protein [Anaerolineae bacterium]
MILSNQRAVPSADPFQVAIVQHPPVFLNLDESIKKAIALVQEAAHGGAQVVIFPETWLPGYPVWLDNAPGAGLWDHAPAKALYRLLVENSMTLPGPHLAQLQAATRQAGIYLVMGLHERLGGTLYNTMLFLDRRGTVRQAHRKLMPTYTERLVWGRGDGSTLAVVETDHGPLGGLICWEHWMPLARAAMQAQGEILHVAQWPWAKELHHLASRHYAFEGQCFVAVAGCILSHRDALEGFDSLSSRESGARQLLESMPGEGDDLLMQGGSALVAPDTGYTSGPVYGQATILYGHVEPARIVEGHLALDTGGHYARPDIFQLRVDDRPQPSVRFVSENEGKEPPPPFAQ